jgi:hypothetical protein
MRIFDMPTITYAWYGSTSAAAAVAVEMASRQAPAKYREPSCNEFQKRIGLNPIAAREFGPKYKANRLGF